MARMAVVLMILVAAVGVMAQTPQIQNGRVQTQAATSLTRDVTALTTQATTPMWVAWQVAKIDGDRDACCTYYSDGMTAPVRGCRMEPTEDGERWTPPSFPEPTGPVQLEAGTSLVVYLRLVNGRIERVRVLSDSCPVDAGGRDVRWLTGVPGADSVAYLKSLATNESLDVDVKSPIANAAIRAIAQHRDPSAVDVLIDIARAPAYSTHAISIRRQAIDGLGQSRDPRALQFLAGLITK